MTDDKQAQHWNEEAASETEDSAGMTGNGRRPGVGQPSHFIERQCPHVAAALNYICSNFWMRCQNLTVGGFKEKGF